MPPFSGWGSLLWSPQIHYEETVKSLGVSVTHLIGLGRMKGSASLGATQWFMNPGPLDCKFSALTTRLLLHKTKYGLYIILKINFSIVLGSPILCMPIYEELILRNRNFWNLFPTNINWEQSPQIVYQNSLVIISISVKVRLTKFELLLYFGLGFLISKKPYLTMLSQNMKL